MYWILKNIKQEFGDLFGSKITTKGKFSLNPAFNFYNLIFRYNSKKLNKSISVKKKKKHYRQSGTLLFLMLKVLDSYLYLKLNLVKNQLRIRSSIYVIEHMKWQHRAWGGCVSQSRSSVWASHPTFRSSLHCRRAWSNETSCYVK